MCRDKLAWTLAGCSPYFSKSCVADKTRWHQIRSESKPWARTTSIPGNCKWWQTPKPKLSADNSNAAVAEWEKNDAKAWSHIILSISPSELKEIKNYGTSREIWLRLEENYKSKGPARKATLLKNLILCKMPEDGEVREHLREFFDSVDKLGDVEIEINCDLLAVLLLYSSLANF